VSPQKTAFGPTKMENEIGFRVPGMNRISGLLGFQAEVWPASRAIRSPGCDHEIGRRADDFRQPVSFLMATISPRCGFGVVMGIEDIVDLQFRDSLGPAARNRGAAFEGRRPQC